MAAATAATLWFLVLVSGTGGTSQTLPVPYQTEAACAAAGAKAEAKHWDYVCIPAPGQSR